METDHSQLYADVDDAGVLRELLHDATMQLQAAARMGLELVEQNRAMQRRLERLEQDQEELQQRVGLAERDRRWMQEQSLRVDQLRASVGDLAAQAEGSRARRAAHDKSVGRLDYSVDKLRQDLDALMQTVDQNASLRRRAVEIGSIQRSLGETRDDVGSLASLVEGLREMLDGSGAQQRTRHADLARQVAELDGQAAKRDDVQGEMQAQIDSLSEGVAGLEQMTRSVVADYHTTLSDHEQAIRTLTDTQVQLAEERQWMALKGSHSRTPLLQTPLTATGPQQQQRRRHQQQQQQPNGATTVSLAPKHRGRRDSAARTGMPERAGGECLDDIFAGSLDVSSGNSSGCRAGRQPLPSPVSTAGEPGSAHHHAWPPVVAGHPRKAASVVAPSRRRASRPRVSSFSQVIGQHSSPQTLSTVAGFSVISTPSHVGVGWGNYWEARRHRLQFDIQQRLNISIAHGERPRTQSAPSSARALHQGDLATAD